MNHPSARFSLLLAIGFALLVGGCSGVGVQGQAGYTIHWDFEEAIGNEWSTDRTYDFGNNKILGIFNDRNRKYPNAAILTIENIAPDTPVQLAFDLFFIGGWDSGGELADRWTLTIKGGDTLIDMTSFDYAMKEGERVNPNSAHGQVDTGKRTLAYHTIDHEVTIRPEQIPAGGTLVLAFRGYLTGHGTEFWALDNVRLTVGTPQ